MPKVFITRQIPEIAVARLKEAGFEVEVSPKEGVLAKDELITALAAKPYDAVLCLLTDQIDAEVFEAVPTAKIFANYAVGFDNIDILEAEKRGVIITNTPGILTDAVAEFTIALILAVTRRIVEADNFIRGGNYNGWSPMLLLGTELAGKTLGIVGTGRIGSEVARIARQGFGMNIAYYDVAQNIDLEKAHQAVFYSTVEAVLQIADVVSIHVPLLDSTKHLINKDRLSLMKASSILINTSRGPVIDEVALVEALQHKTIRGAGLDVFEFEPKLTEGLQELSNVVLSPHIASATEKARDTMAEIAVSNIIEVVAGRSALNPVR